MKTWNCDDTLSALSTGGPLERRRARRHAAGCPRCAETLAELGRIADALTTVPPLSDRERRLWAGALPAVPGRVRGVRPLRLAGAFALAVLVPAGVWLARRPGGPGSDPVVVRVVDPGAVKAMAIREVDEVRDGVETLAHELAGLRTAADLLDARRDADALQRRFAPRDTRGDF